MREKEIESRLVREVKRRGVPDRIVMLPGGRIGFVELKAPGKKPRPLQLSRHRLFRGLGFLVFVVDSIDQIPPTIDEIGGSDVNER